MLNKLLKNYPIKNKKIKLCFILFIGKEGIRFARFAGKKNFSEKKRFINVFIYTFVSILF